MLVVTAVVPAGAQEAPAPEPLPENPFERLAEIRRRQAEGALRADLLRLSAVEVRERLAEVEAWVASQEKVVSSAQKTLVDATLAAETARVKEKAKAQELADLEVLMAEIAVAAYVRPPETAELEVLILSEDLHDAAKAGAMLRAKSDHDHDVAEELSEATEALGELRAEADEQQRVAAQAAEEAATALGELQQAKLEQVALAERIKSELDQTALELLELGPAEADAVLAVQRETNALLARASSSPVAPTVEVEGFRVHESIAPVFAQMIKKAKADGIVLGGWGYRTTERQIELRRQHCGGEGISDIDAVYSVPPGACSPPTAKPGTSMHELGLAIDFTHDGASIATRDSPAFEWLAEHAPSYGLFNLPSEPWHWSVNGK